MKQSASSFVLSFVLLAWLFVPSAGASQCRVMAVMSYDPTYPWTASIMEGVRETVGASCEVTFFHLNTKNDLEGGPAKARMAYKWYMENRPDGIIAADDNAQTLFVVPYLANHVETPVVFCGVNAEPEAYGYPAANVTGVLERMHTRESIAFARQFAPHLKDVCFIARDTITGRAIKNELLNQMEALPANLADVALVRNFAEAQRTSEELSRKCDLLFIDTLEGLPDDQGRPLPDSRIIPAVVEGFGGPTICSNEYAVRFGVLAAVAKSGHQQGALAGEMLLTILGGVPVADIPIARNLQGKRLINVMTMRRMGFTPPPEVLRGAELVKTPNTPLP